MSRLSQRPTPTLDQIARLAPVVGQLARFRGGTVLDVGSGSQGVAPWLGPEWCVTALDSTFDDYSGEPRTTPQGVSRVVGDARALPFHDASFQVTVAVDLLEHLDAADREAALTELCRVSRRLVLVACPMGRPALQADQQLTRAYVKRSRPQPGWLPEHLANGLPEEDDVVALLSGYGRAVVVGNENVHWHSAMMRATARAPGFHAERLLARILAPMLESPSPRGWSAGCLKLMRGLDRAPTYRTLVAVDRTA
jgi:hypothetical protein